MIVTTLTVIAATLPMTQTQPPAAPAAPRSFASLLQQSRAAPADAEPEARSLPAAAPTSPNESTAADETAQPKGAVAPRLRDGAKAASHRSAAGIAAGANLPGGTTDPIRPSATRDDDDAGAAAMHATPWLPGALPARPASAETVATRDAPLDGAALLHSAPAAPAAAELAGAALRDEAASAAASTADAVTTPLAIGAPNPSTPALAAHEVATVAAPVGSPEFAEALAIHVSVLVSAGAQRAELHLNPADMGPVSVQIVVDGTQAQVDFGADLAATRQAIEASLPELASALREAGMTLHSGGVSQHARDRHDAEPSQDRSGQSTNPSAASDTRTPASPPRRTVVAGGIDLYA